MAPFSAPARSYSETKSRTSAEYVKFDPKYRVVLRMLEPEARQVWKHWIGAANGGKGLSPVCPNVEPGLNICPVEKAYAHLPKDDQERKNNYARRKFVINVLDRTPHTTCPSCETVTPGTINPANPGTKRCIRCEADLKDATFAPLDKIKILEHGPRLFNDQLNVIDEMQKQDFKKDITEYDITFTTQGSGREKKITAIPQDPKPLPEDALLDKETGEPQKKFDLDALTEPETVEVIELMMEGATIDQINAVRGIE